MKKRAKKLLAVLMSASMLNAPAVCLNASAAYDVTMPQISQGHWETDKNGEHFVYFYDQLRPEAKRFYNALMEMYEEGIFKTGTGEYDLVANGVVTQDQLSSYYLGDYSLLNTYGAARDAFYADHPEVFYVNFDNLTVTVKEKADKSFAAYLGSGRTDNYYREGYTSPADIEKAEEAVDNAAAELVKIGEEAAKEPDATAPPASENQGGEETASSPDPDATPLVLNLDDLRPGTSDEEKYRPKTADEKKITAIHDALIRNTVYKLDTADQNDPKHCKIENIGNVRTVYGPLVAHESLCEGYSKAMKLVLDKAGIPCVTIQGVYKHTEEQMELHMWNYVRIHEGENDVWYGVDATFDDPSVFNGEHMNDVNSGHESTEYLLVGADIMDRQHVESGEMSECGFEFKYPVLEMSGVSFDTVYSLGGLDVQYTSDCNAAFGTHMGSATPAFKVSYNGKGYVKAAKEDNMYILVKFYGLNTETEGGMYSESDWIYADMGLYDPQELGSFETDEYVLFPAWQSQYMEFAVTDIPPKGHWYPNQKVPENPDIPDPADKVFGIEQAEYQYFMGNPTMFAEQTGMLYNPYEVQYPVPFVRRSTPSMSGRFYIEDGAKECEIVYDQPLVKVGASLTADEETEIPLNYKEDYTVEAFDLTENAALGNVKVENVVTNMRLVGDRTIKMTLKPDESWAGDTIGYDINITGLQGAVSKMQPMTITFVTSHRAAVCAYRSRGYFWNLFAKPQLMENTDISVSDWKTSDGTPVDQSLSNRIALVVSETGKAKSDKMNEMIESETGREVLSSSTYDLSLTICNKNILSTGTSVRLCVGFPAPYGPDDEGVKFTAYHFKKDSQGNTVGVEEIPCEVTKYGLVIWCKDFSPFAIAASKETAEDKADQKSTVTVFNNAGGKVASDAADENGVIGVSPEAPEAKLSITPDDGYAIDAITINGELQTVPEKGKPAEVTVTWKEGVNNTLVDVTFAKTSVLEKEEQEAEKTGEKVVKPMDYDPERKLTPEASDFTMKPDGAASATISNHSAIGKTFAVVRAQYDGSGKMISVNVDKKEISAGDMDVKLETAPLGEIKGSELKAFLWEPGNGSPMAPVQTVTVSAAN